MDHGPEYFSDEYDDMDGFLSDHSSDSIYLGNEGRIPEVTIEQRLRNLFFYIMNGNIVGVCESFDSGIDINAVLQDRWTPIVLAASVGNQEIVHELISRGANVNEHRDHCTALMSVCKCPDTTSPLEKSYEIALELIENGANVNATTRKRETALMFAASTGNVKIFEKLLACCDISAEDNRGWNSLFWAVDTNRIEIVQILLNAGLNSEKQDLCGNTVLQYAKMHEYEDIINLLSTHNEDSWNVTLKTNYDFEEMFADSSRPQFLQDIFGILYGMRCENLQRIFMKTELLHFLSLNDDLLTKIGVNLPYQRKRILVGLHKFHKHLFKQKSIPIVPKGTVYTSVDVSHVLLALIRHLTVMEASLLYILQSNVYIKDHFTDNVCSIKAKLNKLKKTVKILDSRTQEWDISNKPADLIVWSKTWPKWIKKCVTFSVISMSGILL